MEGLASPAVTSAAELEEAVVTPEDEALRAEDKGGGGPEPAANDSVFGVIFSSQDEDIEIPL